MTTVADLYAAVSGLVAEYPKLCSAISVGGILTAGWAYWRRPIINARLGKKAGSHGLVMVDYRKAGSFVESRSSIFACVSRMSA